MSLDFKVRDNIEKSFSLNEEQTSDAKEMINQAIEKQTKMKLGNSSNAAERMLAGHMKASVIKELLSKGFQFVEIPGERVLPRFVGSPEATTVSTYKTPPKYALVRLSEGTSKLKCLSDSRQEHAADLPIIPTTTLALAERVQDICPSAEFFMALEPEWVPQPQRDPVLLAKIAPTYWINVGHWGSDAEAILNMLEENKVASDS